MINFCVRDLAGLVDALRNNGVNVHEEIVETEEGKFTWFIDPEGNKIELWEPLKF